MNCWLDSYHSPQFDSPALLFTTRSWNHGPKQKKLFSDLWTQAAVVMLVVLMVVLVIVVVDTVVTVVRLVEVIVLKVVVVMVVTVVRLVVVMLVTCANPFGQVASLKSVMSFCLLFKFKDWIKKAHDEAGKLICHIKINKDHTWH